MFRQLEAKLVAQPWITDALKQMTKTTNWQQVKDAVQTGTMAINLVRGVTRPSRAASSAAGISGPSALAQLGGAEPAAWA